MHGNLIGKTIRIVHTATSLPPGFEGTIIDETKKTIILQHGQRTITLLKNTITFYVGEKQVNGKDIQWRSEDRIKKC